MAEQNYSNHTRWYPAHHFIFYPAVALLLGIGLYGFFTDDANKWTWGCITFIALLLGWLSFMVRQHYALMIQDRLIRLEMRQRFFELTGKSFRPAEAQLTLSQICALRFACDDELPALIDKTIAEKLSVTAIKKSVTRWMPDHMRV